MNNVSTTNTNTDIYKPHSREGGHRTGDVLGLHLWKKITGYIHEKTFAILGLVVCFQGSVPLNKKSTWLYHIKSANNSVGHSALQMMYP